MLRTYKRNGKLWRYEEGEQPADAVLAEVSAPAKQTPESRASKAATKRTGAKKGA